MDEKYQLFLKLSKILQDFFQKAIEKSKAEQQNINILSDLSKAAEFKEKILPFCRNYKISENAIFTDEVFYRLSDQFLAGPDKNKDTYCQLLYSCLSNETDNKKIKILLETHTENLALFRQFADISLDKLQNINIRKIPTIKFDLSHYLHRDCVRLSTFNTHALDYADHNDFSVLFNIFYCFDDLRFFLHDQNFSHKETEKLVQKHLTKPPLFEISQSNIDLMDQNISDSFDETRNILHKYDQSQHGFTIDIDKVTSSFEKGHSEDLFKQMYDPKSGELYGQGLENPLVNTEKPVYSHSRYMDEYYEYLGHVFGKERYKNTGDAGQIFKLLKHYNHYQMLWNYIPDETQPHIYYLRKIQSLNRAHMITSELETFGYIPRNSVTRFLRSKIYSDFYKKMANDNRKQSSLSDQLSEVIYYNKNITCDSHVSSLLDAFDRTMSDSKAYYQVRLRNTHQLFLINQRHLRPAKSNINQESDFAFTGSFIKKTAANLTKNLFDSRKFAPQYGIYSSSKQMIGDMANFLDPKYMYPKFKHSDLKKLFEDIEYRKNHRISQQSKFNFVFLSNVFSWHKALQSNKLDVEAHVKSRIKLGPEAKLTDDQKSLLHYYQDQIELSQKALSNPETKFTQSGDSGGANSHFNHLIDMACSHYQSIVKKMGNAFGFDAELYIDDLYNSQSGMMDISDLDAQQKYALNVLKSISPPFDLSSNNLGAIIRSGINYDVFAAYADMLDDINTHLTEDILHSISASYKKDKAKKKNAAIEFNSSSDNGDTQNSLDRDISEVSQEADKYDVFEHDYMKRIAKENKKRAKLLIEKSKQAIKDQLNRKGQSAFPKQNFTYNPNEQKSLNDVFCEILESRQVQKQYGVGIRIIPLKVNEISNILRSARTESNVIQLFTQQQQVLARTGTDGFTNYSRTGRGLRVVGSGNVSAGRGTIKAGPGYIAPMPMPGRIAGGYIGAFIVLPKVTKDIVTIASPNTKLSEKGYAVFDLGFIAGSAWAFTKYIAKKYPKTAAAILVYSAGEHAWDCTQPLLRELEKGQTGMTLYFANKKSYLKSGVSCIDGRIPVLMNPNSSWQPIIQFENKK